MSRVRRLLSTAVKRGTDVALAVVAGVVTAPVLPVIAAAIRIDSRGGTFFQHSRLGRFGREIKLVKLRTMIPSAPEIFHPDGSRVVTSNDARVTRLGRFLRGGIDELPQVVNVLRGDLSFVGPRPDDLYAVDLYRGAEWLKLAVRPGITGLAAVSGRNDLPWRTRLLYDIYYASHRTFWLDMRILLKTASIALSLSEPGGLVSLEAVEAYAKSIEAVRSGEHVEARVRKFLADMPEDPRYSIPPERRPRD